MSRSATVVSWSAQVVVAAILVQTLLFKFTGAEESRQIFSMLGVEPWGRVGSGVVELIAAVLLLLPRVVVAGAALSLAVITGALASHLLVLGIEVRGDGGLLFALACIVFAGSALVLVIRRQQAADWGSHAVRVLRIVR